jgi:hypothetical protein
VRAIAASAGEPPLVASLFALLILIKRAMSIRVHNGSPGGDGSWQGSSRRQPKLPQDFGIRWKPMSSGMSPLTWSFASSTVENLDVQLVTGLLVNDA